MKTYAISINGIYLYYVKGKSLKQVSDEFGIGIKNFYYENNMTIISLNIKLVKRAIKTYTLDELKERLFIEWNK